MPCDTQRQRGQTEQERRAAIDRALVALEQSLSAGLVKLVVGRDGAVAFADWGPAQRSGVTDVCAYRTLLARGSWALRQAQARAEAVAGRAVDRAKVAAGVHSHDGGGSWHAGH